MDKVCSFNCNPFSPRTSGTFGQTGRDSVEHRRAFQIYLTGLQALAQLPAFFRDRMSLMQRIVIPGNAGSGKSN
jgi:hypothetical protein